MAKFYVVQGSVLVERNKSVPVGGLVELEPKVAGELVANGFLLEEKQFHARKKMLEGALDSGGVLSKGDEKLAKALGLKAGAAEAPAKKADDGKVKP